jgi:methyl-accepting chemotaxis protein
MTRRIIGTLLILLGALGIALSALGVVYVWRAAEDVTIAAEDGLILVSDTLKDVERSLDVASTTLDGGVIAIDGLYTTTLDVSRTLSSTLVTVDEMAGLAEDDLPQSIEASLTALDALEETAAVIDQLLRSLQQLGLGGYDPAVPLDQAVAEAGAGLAPVPESLRTMGAGLHQTSAGLDEVQSGIALMADHMMIIRQDVVDADVVLSSHRDNLQQLQTRVRNARRNVDRPIQTVAWGTTLLLIWIGLSQLAIVRWGIGLWQRRDR